MFDMLDSLENSEENMDKRFLQINSDLIAYQNAAHAKGFLLQCYQMQGLSNAEEAAYTNCTRFVYSLEHGDLYLNQAFQSPLAIQPALAFYGLSHYIKACLLTVDADYPATVQVLAHGLSARKRKKQNYSFLQDEVRTQRYGLFTHFSNKMFHVEHLEGTKLKMNALLKQVPELSSIFSFQSGKAPFEKVQQKDENYAIPIQLLDDYQMTEHRFSEFLEAKTMGRVNVIEADKHLIYLKPLSLSLSPPFRFHFFTNEWVFSKSKESEAFYPELLIYYSLLYNLSMIARYETEWWYDLLKHAPGKEYSLIKYFTEVSIQKIPLLIAQFLHTQKNKPSNNESQ